MVDISNLANMSQRLQEDMKSVPINKISNGDGSYYVSSEGSDVGGLLAFPKFEVKAEDKLKRLL